MCVVDISVSVYVRISWELLEKLYSYSVGVKYRSEKTLHSQYARSSIEFGEYAIKPVVVGIRVFFDKAPVRLDEVLYKGTTSAFKLFYYVPSKNFSNSFGEHQITLCVLKFILVLNSYKFIHHI